MPRTDESSKPTAQDNAVKEVKGASRKLLTLLKNWKGKTKEETKRASAQDYYKTLSKQLPLLFNKRWQRSSAIGLWDDFERVWNNGDCKWTDAYKALKPLNDALEQSE